MCKVWTWPKFYNRIKARDAVAGRPASDPEVVLAVWLYASVEGIGSARAIDRLCQQHAAYRWLCGGVPINYDLLAAFRRENAALLDRLLTQSITGLVAEKLISLEELAIDGTKVRACANPPVARTSILLPGTLVPRRTLSSTIFQNC